MRAEAQRHHAPSRRAPQLLLDEPFGCGEAAVGVVVYPGDAVVSFSVPVVYPVELRLPFKS